MIMVSIVLVFMLVVGFTSSASAQYYLDIYGRIDDYATGAPAGNTDVILEHDYQGNTYYTQYQVTDANGNFTFSIIAPYGPDVYCVRPITTGTPYSSFVIGRDGDSLQNGRHCIYVDESSYRFGISLATFRGIH
jgi:uncharacterized membrane protein